MDDEAVEIQPTLTSTADNVLLCQNNDKNDANDSTPTSSTDAASTYSTTSLNASDDPISSTSSEHSERNKILVRNMNKDMETSKTMLGADSDVDLLDMNVANVFSEPINEDVEDIVQDLENLLGEPEPIHDFPSRRKEEQAETSKHSDVKSIDKKSTVTPEVGISYKITPEEVVISKDQTDDVSANILEPLIENITSKGLMTSEKSVESNLNITNVLKSGSEKLLESPVDLKGETVPEEVSKPDNLEPNVDQDKCESPVLNLVSEHLETISGDGFKADEVKLSSQEIVSNDNLVQSENINAENQIDLEESEKAENAVQEFENSTKKSEDSSQKSGDSLKKSEDAGEKSEDADEKSEDADEKSEGTLEKSEDALVTSENFQKETEVILESSNVEGSEQGLEKSGAELETSQDSLRKSENFPEHSDLPKTLEVPPSQLKETTENPEDVIESQNEEVLLPEGSSEEGTSEVNLTESSSKDVPELSPEPEEHASIERIEHLATSKTSKDVNMPSLDFEDSSSVSEFPPQIAAQDSSKDPSCTDQDVGTSKASEVLEIEGMEVVDEAFGDNNESVSPLDGTDVQLQCDLPQVDEDRPESLISQEETEVANSEEPTGVETEDLDKSAPQGESEESLGPSTVTPEGTHSSPSISSKLAENEDEDVQDHPESAASVSEDLEENLNEEVETVQEQEEPESLVGEEVEREEESAPEILEEAASVEESEDISAPSIQDSKTKDEDISQRTEQIESVEKLGESSSQIFEASTHPSVEKATEPEVPEETESAQQEIFELPVEKVNESPVEGDIEENMEEDFTETPVEENAEPVVAELNTDDMEEESATLVDHIIEPEVETTELVTEEITQPVAEDVAESIEEDISESVAEVTETVSQASTKEVVDEVTEETTESVVEEAIENFLEEETESAVENKIDTVVEEVAEPSIEELEELVADESTEPVVEDITKLSEEDNTEQDTIESGRGVTEPVEDKITEPREDEITEPGVDETTDPVSEEITVEEVLKSVGEEKPESPSEETTDPVIEEPEENSSDPVDDSEATLLQETSSVQIESIEEATEEQEVTESKEDEIMDIPEVSEMFEEDQTPSHQKVSEVIEELSQSTEERSNMQQLVDDDSPEDNIAKVEAESVSTGDEGRIGEKEDVNDQHQRKNVSSLPESKSSDGELIPVVEETIVKKTIIYKHDCDHHKTETRQHETAGEELEKADETEEKLDEKEIIEEKEVIEKTTEIVGSSEDNQDTQCSSSSKDYLESSSLPISSPEQKLEISQTKLVTEKDAECSQKNEEIDDSEVLSGKSVEQLGEESKNTEESQPEENEIDEVGVEDSKQKEMISEKLTEVDEISDELKSFEKGKLENEVSNANKISTENLKTIEIPLSNSDGSQVLSVEVSQDLKSEEEKSNRKRKQTETEVITIDEAETDDSKDKDSQDSHLINSVTPPEVDREKHESPKRRRIGEPEVLEIAEAQTQNLEHKKEIKQKVIDLESPKHVSSTTFGHTDLETSVSKKSESSGSGHRSRTVPENSRNAKEPSNQKQMKEAVASISLDDSIQDQTTAAVQSILDNMLAEEHNVEMIAEKDEPPVVHSSYSSYELQKAVQQIQDISSDVSHIDDVDEISHLQTEEVCYMSEVETPKESEEKLIQVTEAQSTEEGLEEPDVSCSEKQDIQSNLPGQDKFSVGNVQDPEPESSSNIGEVESPKPSVSEDVAPQESEADLKDNDDDDAAISNPEAEAKSTDEREAVETIEVSEEDEPDEPIPPLQNKINIPIVEPSIDLSEESSSEESEEEKMQNKVTSTVPNTVTVKLPLPPQDVEEKEAKALPSKSPSKSEKIVETSPSKSDTKKIIPRETRHSSRISERVREKPHAPKENMSEPLSISVDETEKEKVYSPKITIKPIKEDEVIEDKEEHKGSLKITITKQSDNTHSILKICSPEADHRHRTDNDEQNVVPKLVIKTADVEQHSPKMSTRSSKQSVSSNSNPRSGSPRITIKPIVKPDGKETITSPLKITIKPMGKPEEFSKQQQQRHSPKLPKSKSEDDHYGTRSKVLKSTENSEVHSPKVTIKPIMKPVDEGEQIITPKITIKPLEKPEEAKVSPKITIKPVVRPPELETELEDEFKERIVLKINKGTIPSKETDKINREMRKREHEDDKSEKLAKIKLKFSKGGDAHIVHEADTERHSHSPSHKRGHDLDRPSSHSPSNKRSHESESERNKRIKSDNPGNHSDDDVTIIENRQSPIVISEDSQSQDSVIIVEPTKDPLADDASNEAKSMVITATPPAQTGPRKRGRPRKVPLVAREDYVPVQKESQQPVVVPVGEPVTPETPESTGRPKRSCRGQSVRDTLGIKPRKQKSPSKPRGGKRGGGAKGLTGKPEKEIDTSVGEIKPRKSLTQEAVEDAQANDALPIIVSVETVKETEVKKGETVTKPIELKGLLEAAKDQNIIEVIEVDSPSNSPKSIHAVDEPENVIEIEEVSPENIDDSVSIPQESVSANKDEVEGKKDDADIVKDDVDLIKDDVDLNQEISELGTVASDVEMQPPTPVFAPPLNESSAMDISHSSDITMFEEETRMSADASSRAQTPAKQVISSDVVEESQSSMQSTATTESVKIRRSRLEVFQEQDGSIFTADQLNEYNWGGNGPFMIQEQVAQFLGIKSFKRKYPGIPRRMVDMQERDYIRENGLASESMCDLGLTAVNSADILDIMYSDFQEKYEEYCKHQREKQAKDLLSKQKAMSMAASQEKSKLDLADQAKHSAAAFNANFNKTRREQRKACMDLQTMNVHYPKGRLKQVTMPRIGNYPVAVVPGQYTDYYKEFTPTELNNLPLNTMLYTELHKILPEVSDSDSDSSGSDSDDSSSGGSDSDSSCGDSCKMCNTTDKRGATTPRKSPVHASV